MTRRVSRPIQRVTNETSVEVAITLDGTGKADIVTGLGFLDHMLAALSKHSRIDIMLRCDGDLEVDDHHTVEDCAIVLGRAIDDALGDRQGVRRFGSSYAPLDESLARAVVDLSGRPHATCDLHCRREAIGAVATENLKHFVVSLATTARCTIHLDVLRGENDHHKIEAAFKALALALRAAIVIDQSDMTVPSTKGVLS